MVQFSRAGKRGSLETTDMNEVHCLLLVLHLEDEVLTMLGKPSLGIGSY